MASRNRGKKQQRFFSQDQALWKVFQSLVIELYPSERIPSDLMKIIAKKDINALRRYNWPTSNEPKTFKALAQLSTFFKRCILENDSQSFDDLALTARTEFDFFQFVLMEDFPKCMPKYAEDLIREASREAKRILGDFSADELIKRCGWGKRAANGLRREESYLDIRVRRLTGTKDQLRWFNYARRIDPLLRSATRRGVFCEVDTVTISAVPKSFKAVRTIAPDTVLGGFLSRGLGDYLAVKLRKQTNIDIRSAQDEHKRIAREASLHGRLATIDMSKASDSFKKAHLDVLLPASWREIVDVVRTPYYRHAQGHKGASRRLSSYMLMGSGHTFPLQTILFYSLAKAACSLCGVTTPVFVYGDDIIMDTRVVKAFMKAMSALGFMINKEKSFYVAADPFRESCGGDYLKGVDVRPCMPESLINEVPRNNYLSFLYKLYNGLAARWGVIAICDTLSTIRDLHFEVTKRELPLGILGVIPDDSAVLYPSVLLDYEEPKWKNGSFKLRCLLVRRTQRKVQDELPHYWDALRTKEHASAPNPWDPDDGGSYSDGNGKARFEQARGLPTRYNIGYRKIYPIAYTRA